MLLRNSTLSWAHELRRRKKQSHSDTHEIISRPRPRDVEVDLRMPRGEVFCAVHELDPGAAVDEECRTEQALPICRERYCGARVPAQLGVELHGEVAEFGVGVVAGRWGYVQAKLPVAIQE